MLDGRVVTVGDVRGRVDGLAPDGALRVDGWDGTAREVHAGTVEAVEPPLAVAGPR